MNLFFFVECRSDPCILLNNVGMMLKFLEQCRSDPEFFGTCRSVPVFFVQCRNDPNFFLNNVGVVNLYFWTILE